MKKIISIALLIALCLSLFAGCGKKDDGLDKAKKYLDAYFQSESTETSADYTLIGVVMIDNVSYNIDWTCDFDQVVITRQDKMVFVDIPACGTEEVPYILTATISDSKGNTITATYSRKIPASAGAGLTDEQIVENAYKLEDGQVMEGVSTLTGKITMIKTPYDAGYKNITVIIQIGELTDKRIECYRLKGDGAENLASGDTITVTGTLKNYQGTIEFDAGCTLDKVVKGEVVTAPTDPKEILAAAYALSAGDSLPYSATLTGVITSISSPYAEQYQNISVMIQVEDKIFQCYRLKGEGAKDLAIGDTITVTGTLTNYNGNVQFGQGCTLDKVVKGEGPVVTPTAPTDPKEIVDALYALKAGESLPYSATLTGKITKIDTAYSPDYKNITVSIVVEGREDKPIVCYRLKGEGAETLKVDDIITVTGTLTNYNGTFEYTSGCTLDAVGNSAPAVDYKAIVEEAYKLESGVSMTAPVTLVGKITAINTAYSAQYGNITVTMEIEGCTDKPIQCYRLAGTGADKLAVGDTITVTGTITNYNGKIQFAQGCTLDAVVSGGGTVPVAPTDPKEIVDALYALKAGESLPYSAVLTGKITKIDTAYSPDYKNITVTIAVEGREDKPIVCYRLKGNGAENLKVGDTITVTGTLTNYSGTFEYTSGCTFNK